jgi:N-acetylmuramoyl-L-alanine amidase
MPEHEVQQGECLATIARQYGITDWQLLWDHPDNAPLRERRSSPHVLMPGDTVVIPDDIGPAFDGRTGERGTFRLTPPRPVRLVLKLRDGFGSPFASREYQLEVGDETIEGRTGEDGLLDCEIPPDAASGTLTLRLDSSEQSPERKIVWELNLGHLDPIDEISGVQGRLRNLGYPIDELNGDLDEATRKALETFQAAEEIPVTGEIDEATRTKLLEKYGV